MYYFSIGTYIIFTVSIYKKITYFYEEDTYNYTIHFEDSFGHKI